MASTKAFICLIIVLIAMLYGLPEFEDYFLIKIQELKESLAIVIQHLKHNFKHQTLKKSFLLQSADVDTLFWIAWIFVLFLLVALWFFVKEIIAGGVKAFKKPINEKRKREDLWKTRIEAVLSVNSELGQVFLNHRNNYPDYSPFYR